MSYYLSRVTLYSLMFNAARWKDLFAQEISLVNRMKLSESLNFERLLWLLSPKLHARHLLATKQFSSKQSSRRIVWRLEKKYIGKMKIHFWRRTSFYFINQTKIVTKIRQRSASCKKLHNTVVIITMIINTKY